MDLSRLPYCPPASPIAQPVWPIYSLFFLFLTTSFLPISLISGMNGYFLLLALFVWAASKSSFPKSLWVLLSCFAGIMALGLLSGYDNDLYDYLKDAWYIVNPLAVIFVGYCFGAMSPRLPKVLRVLVVAGLILALFHLARFAVNPTLITQSATEVRGIAGNGSFIVGLSFALLLGNLGRWRESLGIGSVIGGLILLICGASTILAFSRTLVLVALVFWLALRGLMIGSRFVKVGAAGLVALALIALLAAYLPPATEADKKSFTGKMLRSVQELTISDYRDEQSINDNYRGFETARALKNYADGGPVGWLAGRGFGFLVDLGFYLNLGDPMRYIPVLHNGMIYILVKTGAIGLILYLASFAWLFRRGSRASSSTDPDERFAGRIVQGTVAVCLLTSWLISGPFNKNALVSTLLLLGFCLAIVERKEWHK